MQNNIYIFTLHFVHYQDEQQRALSILLPLDVCSAMTYLHGARKYDYITPLLKELKWLPVAKQLYYRSGIMAFKCMTGCAPEYLSTEFVKRVEINNRTTRNSQKLNIPLFKTASGQRTFYYRIVTLWNELDLPLKLSKKVLIFKKNLKSKLMHEFLHE